MTAADFLSGVQHGDINAAYADKGVAGPQSSMFEGAGADKSAGIGEQNQNGMGTSNTPIGDKAQV